MGIKVQNGWGAINKFVFIFLIALLWNTGVLSDQENWTAFPDFVDTIHGKVDLREPVLKELCASLIMQRLKYIHQYGTYDISHPLPDDKKYTRYIHSLGVVKMLQLAKEKGAKIPLAEMIAALLHDCSHTVFSHATDPLLMGGFNKGSYHDEKHAQFLKDHGILDIVKKYGFQLEDVLPTNPKYTALEQAKPSICADRLEYNLYSGYLTGLLTDEDRKAILEDIRFENNQWVFTKPELAAKLARSSLNDALHTWGSPSSLLTGIHASKALKILVDRKILSLEDIKYLKNDQEVWDMMINSSIPEVQQCANDILNIDKTFKVVQKGDHDMILKGKFCGLDPFIQVSGEIIRLTEYDPKYRKEFNETKEIVANGIPIKFISLKKS